MTELYKLFQHSLIRTIGIQLGLVLVAWAIFVVARAVTPTLGIVGVLTTMGTVVLMVIVVFRTFCHQFRTFRDQTWRAFSIQSWKFLTQITRATSKVVHVCKLHLCSLLDHSHSLVDRLLSVEALPQNRYNSNVVPFRVTYFGSNIPARLDSLPWNRFHTRICIVLGFLWALLGLVVTLIGPLDPAIRHTVPVPDTRVDLTVLIYLFGVALGAFLFSWLTDRFGRSRLIWWTLLVAATGTVLIGLAQNVWSFLFFRFVVGAGIGGAYVAVNSALQELIPAQYRGTAVISVNSAFWAGAMLSTLVSLVVLNPAVNPKISWRLAFWVASVPVFIIMLRLRSLIPESPRWLIASGRPAEVEEAKRIVALIEVAGGREGGEHFPDKTVGQLFRPDQTTINSAVRLMLGIYRQRMALGLMMMASQAFLYNGIFFTYARHLGEFYRIPDEIIGRYMLPIAFSNLVGAMLLSQLFDSVGRKLMIMTTYVLSGFLLLITGLLFGLGMLDAWGYTVCWTAIFFVASAAASAAYLTVGEAFPLEMRAMGIGLLITAGTAIGGIAIPLLFELLIPMGDLESRSYLFHGVAAILMVAAGLVAWHLGFPAARKPSEEAAYKKGEG